MIVDLNKLHGQRQHFDRVFTPVNFDPQDPEYRVVAPVELSMDIEKAGKGVYRVHGSAATRLGLDCSRCVEPFEVPVDAAFDLRYAPQTENAGDPEREVTDDDLETSFYGEEGTIDIVEMLREQFQLALPMKPLCTEACRGLCPTCGVNLNRITCECKPEWEDPRLAPLKGLLKQEKEN